LAKVELQRNPRLVTLSDAPEPDLRLALGLDLGTTTGVAYSWFRPGEPFDPKARQLYLGQWDLSPGEYGTNPIRFVRLRHFLEAMRPSIVFFEEVRNTPAAGTITRYNVNAIVARAATSLMLFGAYMSTVTGWCEEREIPCIGIPIADIKRRATSKGNASKEDVIRACNGYFKTEFDPATHDQTGVDNIADAAYCLLVGLEAYADGIAGEDSKAILAGGSPAGAPDAGPGHRPDRAEGLAR
jgi:crossover junction endodeoxyribonuclease RuvC